MGVKWKKSKIEAPPPKKRKKKMEGADHLRKAASHARRAVRSGMDPVSCARTLGPAMVGDVISSLSKAASAMRTYEDFMAYADRLWHTARPRKPSFGMLSPERVDVTMDEADWPIAQFEFTEKAQNSSRLVWTSDTDCTINALQVTGAIGSWCADIMRIMMRDPASKALVGVDLRNLEMAYEHTYCKPFKFTPTKRRDLLAAVRSMKIGGCIVVAAHDPASLGHIHIIVMSNSGPYLADLQKDNRYLYPINEIFDNWDTGEVAILRYAPDADSATVGTSILSHRCIQGQAQKRRIPFIEPILPQHGLRD